MNVVAPLVPPPGISVRNVLLEIILKSNEHFSITAIHFLRFALKKYVGTKGVTLKCIFDHLKLLFPLNKKWFIFSRVIEGTIENGYFSE